MQMQSTYWLEKVLKMISLYVNALLCTLQHIVIYAMQLIEWSTRRRAGFSCATLYVTGGTITVLCILTDTCACKVAERLQTHLKINTSYKICKRIYNL